MGIGTSNTNRLWPNRQIPYEINATDFPPNSTQRQMILAAINHWNSRTIIRLVPRNSQANYADFVAASSSCSSPVGMSGNGRQEVRCNLSSGQFSAGSIIHEIGHTVGLWHEQSREDRNFFVQINFNNIPQQSQHNFQQHIADGDDLGSYDYGSIMHYGRLAFASNPNQPTIVAPVQIGQRNRLSAGDISSVGILYGRTGLWHTVRRNNGAWTSFGDVEGQTGDRGSFVCPSGVGVGGELHVCGVNSVGRLWHSIRRADHSWTRFGDVEGQAGDRGIFVYVSNAGIDGELHVCGVNSNGHLWHAVRRTNGSWTPFGDIEGQTGDRGFFTSLDCAHVNGELHVCGANSQGQVWHAIRRANGSWTPLGDVEGQTGDRGYFISVSCAEVSGELHVCGVNSDGQLWHAIRRTDGLWTGFGDVEDQTGDRGVIVYASCAGIGAELHVSATNTDGHLWHSIRRSDGTWTMFGDVEGQTGDRGYFWRCALAEVAGDLHVCGISFS